MKNKLFIVLVIVVLVFTGAIAVADEPTSVHRLMGANRYTTATAISEYGWEKSDYAVIAYGYNFPDALAAVPFAYNLDCPILLSNSDNMSDETLEEIKRLGVKTVYILGGFSTLSNNIESQLETMGILSIRLSGVDRYETAVKVSYAMMKNLIIKPSTAIVTSGTSFPDALSIGAIAAYNEWPILFSESNNLPTSSLEALKNWNIQNVIIIGGVNAVSQAVEDEIVGHGIAVSRLSGSDRYATGFQVVSHLVPESDGIMVATGKTFPDALTGGVLAAKLGIPLVLCNDEGLSDEVSAYIENNNMEYSFVLGGSLAVGDNVVEQLEGLMHKEPDATQPYASPTPKPADNYISSKTFTSQSIAMGGYNLYTFTAQETGVYEMFTTSHVVYDNVGYLLQGEFTNDDMPNDYWNTAYNPVGGDLGECAFNDNGYLYNSDFRITYNLTANQEYTVLVRGYDSVESCPDFDLTIQFNPEILPIYNGDNLEFLPVVTGNISPEFVIKTVVDEVAQIDSYSIEYYVGSGSFTDAQIKDIHFIQFNQRNSNNTYEIIDNFACQTVTVRARPFSIDSVTLNKVYGEYTDTTVLTFPCGSKLGEFLGVVLDETANIVTISWDSVAGATDYYLYSPAWTPRRVDMPSGQLSYSYDRRNPDMGGEYFYIYAYSNIYGVLYREMYIVSLS